MVRESLTDKRIIVRGGYILGLIEKNKYGVEGSRNAQNQFIPDTCIGCSNLTVGALNEAGFGIEHNCSKGLQFPVRTGECDSKE